MTANNLLTLALIALTFSMLSCAKGSSKSESRPTASTTYGTSCGTNMLNSQYGCLPQCGAAMVMYQNRCVSVTSTMNSNNQSQGGYNGGQIGMGQGGAGLGGANICSAQCGAGVTMVQGSCLPQNTCYACYGYYQGYCYQGDAAQQYYSNGGTP